MARCPQRPGGRTASIRVSTTRRSRIALVYFTLSFCRSAVTVARVMANGIQRADTWPPFSLEVLQTANFNIKMSVGSSKEIISVSGGRAHSGQSSTPRFRARPPPTRRRTFHSTRGWISPPSLWYVPGRDSNLRHVGNHEFLNGAPLTPTRLISTGNRAQSNNQHAGRHRHERDLQQPDLVMKPCT